MNSTFEHLVDKMEVDISNIKLNSTLLHSTGMTVLCFNSQYNLYME